MDTPSTSSDDVPGTRERRSADRHTVRSTLVPAFYGALLLSLLVVAAYGEGVHPLLVAALGSGLVFCWLGWPAYRETVER